MAPSCPSVACSTRALLSETRVMARSRAAGTKKVSRSWLRSTSTARRLRPQPPTSGSSGHEGRGPRRAASLRRRHRELAEEELHGDVEAHRPVGLVVLAVREGEVEEVEARPPTVLDQRVA